MDYVNLEKLDARVSRLGFGCMRFPTTPEGEIDEPRATAMLKAAYDAGVNYFDTAHFYHNKTSETFLGRALKMFPRESFYLATKLPVALLNTLEEAKEIYEGQFVKLDTPYIDFYLLHAMNGERWKMVQETGILDFLIEQQKTGRIRHLGFSFHDSYEVFETMLTAREWDFCQIQFNYMDVDTQAGMKGYELAKRLGVPLIVMEPVKGGSLATLNEDTAAMLKAARPDQSIASWAMRWVGSLDNCKIILSGMSTEEQVADNLATYSPLEPLTAEEQAVIERVREAIRSKVFVGCTACRYCMPCPFGVNIPRNFSMMNHHAMYNDLGRVRWTIKDMKEEERADNCRSCGKCEAACPQQLPIRQKLAEIAAFAGEHQLV